MLGAAQSRPPLLLSRRTTRSRPRQPDFSLGSAMPALMFAVIVFAAHIAQLWYAAPLIVSISLVYAATRHEHMGPILHHALRLGIWITGFMAVVFAILFFLQTGL